MSGLWLLVTCGECRRRFRYVFSPWPGWRAARRARRRLRATPLNHRLH